MVVFVHSMRMIKVLQNSQWSIPLGYLSTPSNGVNAMALREKKTSICSYSGTVFFHPPL
jgi:hypothetical protein